MIRFSILCGIFLISLALGLPPLDEKPTCSKKGRLMNPRDCGSFYECMEDEYARSLLPFQRFCPSGEVFNPSSERCGKNLSVRGCNVRRGRHFDSNPKYDYICKDSNISFACADCQTQITCTEGRAYVTRCENNLRCVADSPDFEGGVCHTHFDDQCRCTKPNSYRRDPFSNSTFFLCESENAVPTYYNCQRGMYFDEISKACVNNDGSPSCTTSGLFMFPENCSKYYMCTFALEGWIQTKMSCPDKQLFNKETERCENPCDWERIDFKCETQGRFQNPRDCRRFTECIDDSKGGLLAMERSCPPGFHWNDEIKKCIVRIFSTCKEYNEGPLKPCKKDFVAICKAKPEAMPEITAIVGEKPVEENPDVVAATVDEINVEIAPEIEEVPEVEQEMQEKPLEENPEEEIVEEKPVDEKPVEENSFEEKPDEKPVEEKPIEEKPFKEKPVDEKPVEEKPVEVKPVEEKPFEEKPVAEKPDVTDFQGKPDVDTEVEEPAVPLVEEKPDEKPGNVEVEPMVENNPEVSPVAIKPNLPQIEEVPQGIQTLPFPLKPEAQGSTSLNLTENEVVSHGTSPQENIIPVQIISENRG